MNTVTDGIARRAEGLLQVLDDLLRKHSGLRRWNRRGSGIISVDGDHRWTKLDEDGRQLQSRALNEYRRLHNLSAALLRNASTDAKRRLAKANKTLRRVIDQSGSTWWKTTDQAYAEAVGALEDFVSVLRDLYDPSGGEPTFVPDTNALIFNVELEKWRFSGVKRFSLLLTPTVLAELDRLKVEHRNEDVRKKAEGLITRIKGYRARGDLLSGVPLAKNKSELRSVAVEPQMDEALDWLDRHNADDRFLATVVEVMRQHPHSPVCLITRDINMQNKASYAGIPFDEPPAP